MMSASWYAQFVNVLCGISAIQILKSHKNCVKKVYMYKDAGMVYCVWSRVLYSCVIFNITLCNNTFWQVINE